MAHTSVLQAITERRGAKASVRSRWMQIWMTLAVQWTCENERFQAILSSSQRIFSRPFQPKRSCVCPQLSWQSCVVGFFCV